MNKQFYSVEIQLKKYGVKTVNYLDTAGAAKLISQSKDKSKAAIASSLAAEIYGLEIKKKKAVTR